MLRHLLNSALVASFILSLNFPQIVRAGGDANTSTEGSSNNNQSTSSTSYLNNVSSPTEAPHYDNYDSHSSYASYGSLNYPSCSGSCAFGIIRFTPSTNGGTNQEAVVGFITEFDSPNKRSAQAYQKYYTAISNRMAQEDEILILTKIADAANNCQDTHVHLLVLSAAKKLNVTPDELLSRAFQQPRKCNSSLNNNVEISK